MKLLKIIQDSDFWPKEKSKVEGNFDRRSAARAVLFDNKNRVAILKVAKYDYHKISGGGMEEGESVLDALKREVLEETGCNIEVVGTIGEIIENRQKFKTIQKSFCYLGNVAGNKGKPNFIGEEIDHRYELKWMDIDKAIRTLESDKPKDYQGHFIQVRDSTFLKEAKKMKGII